MKLVSLLLAAVFSMATAQANQPETAAQPLSNEQQISAEQQAAIAADKINLKRVMKKMRFHYSQASKTPSAEEFNQHVADFKLLLTESLQYDYPEAKRSVSLEGLKKVEQVLAKLPQADQKNLFQVQKQWREIDQLRVDYHDKVKPSPWSLLMEYLGL